MGLIDWLNKLDSVVGNPLELLGIGLLMNFLITDKNLFIWIVMIGLFAIAGLRFILSILDNESSY